VQIQAINFSNPHRRIISICTNYDRLPSIRAKPERAAESLDTASAAGRLVITVMAAVSQWEREAIGERTRDTLRHKRTSGERVGNIRFGFRLSPDGKHVEPDPGEQGVLTEIRHLRQSGHTLRGIAAALNRQSLRTRCGSAWRLEHVARIIKQAAGPR
jgi:DNA invertase Pin-like site-specific DNA recombinase